MPPWMQYLHKKLDQAESHHNIRLFICKLIVNMQEVFRPYAKFWLCPIVRFVTTGYWGAEPMNYFVTDLVTTILSWHAVAIPDVSSLLKKNFLIISPRWKNFHHLIILLWTLKPCWIIAIYIGYGSRPSHGESLARTPNDILSPHVTRHSRKQSTSHQNTGRGVENETGRTYKVSCLLTHAKFEP